MALAIATLERHPALRSLTYVCLELLRNEVEEQREVGRRKVQQSLKQHLQ